MPPKRKPVQKESKPDGPVATKTAVLSEKNTDGINSAEKEVDGPVEDLQKDSDKVPTKKPKNPKKETKVSEVVASETAKENYEQVANDDKEVEAPTEIVEKVSTRRQKKPVNNAKEPKASELVGSETAVASEENSEEVTNDDKVEIPIENVQKAPEKVPSKRQRKPVNNTKETKVNDVVAPEAAVASEDTPETVTNEDKEVETPIENVQKAPVKVPSRRQKKPINNPKMETKTNELAASESATESKEKDEEKVVDDLVENEQKATEKVPSKKQKKPVIPKKEIELPAAEPPVVSGENNKEVTSDDKPNDGSVENVQKASEKVLSKKQKKPANNPKELEANDDSGEPLENKKESPKRKRGGKKNVQESEQEVEPEPSRTRRRGNQKAQESEMAEPTKEEIREHNLAQDNEEKSKDEPQIDQPAKKRGGKKNVQFDALQESEQEMEPPKPRRGGLRSVQAAKEVVKEDPELSDEGSSEPVQEETGEGKKRGRRNVKDDGAGKKNGGEPAEKKSKTEVEAQTDFGCEKENKKGEKWNLKISTWNIAGLRAWVKKSGVDYIKEEDADIICFQETKCPEKKIPSEAQIEGYHKYWVNGVKDGYAGVGLYSKEKPLNVSYGLNNEQHDEEGRVITAEYEKFFLVTTYVPNSGQGLKTLSKRMDWDKIFLNYLKELDAKKPVILCGDLNVAHEEIDLANPKTNTKSAGFTKEERENMTALLKEGFVDSFRQLYPDKVGCYTFWTYVGNARSRNTGWRLDYFVLSERLMDSVCDVAIRSKVLGSDHCPVTLFIHV